MGVPDFPASEADAIKSSGFVDSLTGLGNRHRLREKFQKLAEERAEDPAPFTVALVNLDGFKPINDLFGQAAGDEILCQVAHRLKACMTGHATVTRHDGDEFALILPMIFESVSAERIGHLIKDVLSAPYDLGDRHVRLSASLGLAIHPFAGADFTGLLKSAETALYRSKRRGRGQVTVYSTEIAQEMRRSTQIEQALRNAIINDMVDVHFQPIVSLEDERVLGFEALARWIDPDMGFVSPAIFVPLAEEQGFIDMLSDTLLRKAAEAAVTWPRDLFLSFNLSSAQLTDMATSSRILSILANAGLPPSRLDLEITETAVIRSADMAGQIIADLRQAGVRISLDDFGTGQSSLGRLREFTFDKVKIDRAFVSALSTDKTTEHIIKAIITMCDSLNLDVVAEGIENAEEAERLAAMGCGMGQGYYFGKPIDAMATLRYLKRNYRETVYPGTSTRGFSSFIN